MQIKTPALFVFSVKEKHGILKSMRLVYVNGYKIRQNLDPDFDIIHRNGDPALFDSKWYIPKNEIWFDRAFKGEEEFLKKILLTIKSREEAKRFCKKGQPPNFIIKKETKDGLEIQYVDGKIVREYFDPEFVMAGHDLIYSYISPQTVWLDNRMDKKDIPHVKIHELAERKFMAGGRNYDISHEYATVMEKESRREVGGVYVGDANHSGKFSLKTYYVRRK